MFELLGTAFLGSIGLVMILLQVACLVHAVKTGRPFYWFWIIFAFPGIGILAYFLVEIRPTMGKVNWQALRWKLSSPKERIRVRRQEYEHSKTIKNRYRLADELLNDGQSDEACQILKEGMTGVFADDAELMLRVAEAHLESGRPDDAKQIVERIKPITSADFQFQFRLAKARIMADTQSAGAEESLRELAAMQRNEGPNYFLARMLIQTGRVQEGQEILRDIGHRFRRGTTVWRFQEQRWYQLSKKLLSKR